MSQASMRPDTGWRLDTAGRGMATEAANAAIRYAFGHLGAKAVSIGYFDGNEPSRRIVEKLGFQKLGVAHRAATRPLDGTKLDRHEYILTSLDPLPDLDVSWGCGWPKS